MPRTVVVTGGSAGIGLAIATRFAEAGDSVVITARDADRLQRAASEIGATGIRCDASDPGDVEALLTAIEGGVDVLVNVAGANTDATRSDHTPSTLAEVAEAWEDNLRVNLLGTVLTTTAALPRMLEGAAIIATGSQAAEFAATSYGAAKAALSAWIAGLSSMVGPRGITANTIVPGYTEGTDFYPVPLAEERRTTLIASSHNKRAARPEDIVGLAYFLAGAEARHITGQTLHVSGGAHTTR